MMLCERSTIVCAIIETGVDVFLIALVWVPLIVLALYGLDYLRDKIKNKRKGTE